MKKFLFVLGLLAAYSPAHAVNVSQLVTVPTSIFVSSFTVAGGTATVTLSTPTAGVGVYSAGYYNYVTNIHIEYYATSTLTGGASPVICTVTGMPTNPQYVFPTAEAIGVEQVMDMQFANPVQSTQGTKVVISCPGMANTYWNVQVAYYQGQ